MEPPPLTSGPLVDTHAHIYKLDMPLAGSAWHKPPADATAQDYLDTLDSAGVHFGILAAASIYGDYNDYSLNATRHNPRLRTTVIVRPDVDPYVLREMDESGAVGIRLQFRNVASPPDLTSYEYRCLFRRIADLDWHVHLHDDGHRLPHYLKALLPAGPRLVIDHMARPSLEHGVASESFRAAMKAVEAGKTWVKLSAGFRLASREFADAVAQTWLKEIGPQRLMWGSDWPFAAFESSVTYADVLNDYYRAVPDAGTRSALDRTALAFYFS